MALFDGERCPVHLRVAEHDGRLYLDLDDRGGRCRSIPRAARGRWPPANSIARVALSPSRTKPGGSFEELRPYLNVDDYD